MRWRLFAILLAFSVLLPWTPQRSAARTAAPSAAGGSESIGDSGQLNIEDCYKALDPYGCWVMSERYKCHVFCPKVPEGWRPYTCGHWEFTKPCGLTWCSEDKFGDLPYHYGCWYYDKQYGYCCKLCKTWAPCRVGWRRGDKCICWYPLPPEVCEPQEYPPVDSSQSSESSSWSGGSAQAPPAEGSQSSESSSWSGGTAQAPPAENPQPPDTGWSGETPQAPPAENPQPPDTGWSGGTAQAPPAENPQPPDTGWGGGTAQAPPPDYPQPSPPEYPPVACPPWAGAWAGFNIPWVDCCHLVPPCCFCGCHEHDILAPHIQDCCLHEHECSSLINRTVDITNYTCINNNTTIINKCCDKPTLKSCTGHEPYVCKLRACPSPHESGVRTRNGELNVYRPVVNQHGTKLPDPPAHIVQKGRLQAALLEQNHLREKQRLVAQGVPVSAPVKNLTSLRPELNKATAARRTALRTWTHPGNQRLVTPVPGTRNGITQPGNTHVGPPIPGTRPSERRAATTVPGTRPGTHQPVPAATAPGTRPGTHQPVPAATAPGTRPGTHQPVPAATAPGTRPGTHQPVPAATAPGTRPGTHQPVPAAVAPGTRPGERRAATTPPGTHYGSPIPGSSTRTHSPQTNAPNHRLGTQQPAATAPGTRPGTHQPVPATTAPGTHYGAPVPGASPRTHQPQATTPSHANNRFGTAPRQPATTAPNTHYSAPHRTQPPATTAPNTHYTAPHRTQAPAPATTHYAPPPRHTQTNAPAPTHYTPPPRQPQTTAPGTHPNQQNHRQAY